VTFNSFKEELRPGCFIPLTTNDKKREEEVTINMASNAASKAAPKEIRPFGMAPEKGRWVLLIFCMIINLCLGAIYSWSVFVTPMVNYFGTLGQKVTATEAQWPFSVFLAFFAIAMPLTGKYITKYGPRKVAIVGGILCGLGWLLASLATNIFVLFVTYGLIGGLGVGIAYGCPVNVATKWFPDKRGLAVGLALFGFGFSAFITGNLANMFINSGGIMSTFRIFGIAFIIITILLSLPLSFPNAGWAPKGWKAPAPKPGAVTCECIRSEMIKTPTFFGLWICYFVGCLAGLMAIGIAKPVGTEAFKIESGLATLLVGVFAIFNGGGRPLFGTLTDKLTPRNAALVSFGFIILASALLFWLPGAGAGIYIIGFAILWACLGGWLAIAPAATASYFGMCDYARCYGIVFLAYGAGAIAGPQLAGFIRESTGSYLAVFPYVIGLAIAGIVLAVFLMKPVKKITPVPNPARGAAIEGQAK
jgi:MFS transporter, OFA family, oxalate/formate antiporter